MTLSFWENQLLRSPVSKKKLTRSKSNTLQTEDGDEKFLEFNGSPWIFKNGVERLLNWQAQFNTLLTDLSNNIEKLNVESFTSNSQLTQKRLSLKKEASLTNKSSIQEILKPFMLPLSHKNLLADKLPSNQSIYSYIKNIFRDWAWGESEIKKTMETIESLLAGKSIGIAAVLGAGSCRYSLEFSHLNADKIISVDLNPLLLSIGKKIISGEKIHLYELAEAPLHLEDTAKLYELKSSISPGCNMEYLFSDAINLAFQNTCLDTVITPWFIDIISDPIDTFAFRVNRVLKENGLWINFGPLSFGQQKETSPKSIEEVEEAIQAAGFQVLSSVTKSIEYLNSPIDGGNRTERIYFFVAKKVAPKKEVKEYSDWPDWLQQTSLSVEKSPVFEELKMKTHIHTQILSSVDGVTTVDDLTLALSQSYGLPESEARASLINFFSILYEQHRSRFKD